MKSYPLNPNIYSTSLLSINISLLFPLFFPPQSSDSIWARVHFLLDLSHLRYPIHSIFNADNVERSSLTFLSFIHMSIQAFNEAHWPQYQNVSLSISPVAPCQHQVLTPASSLTSMTASVPHDLSTPVLSLCQAIPYQVMTWFSIQSHQKHVLLASISIDDTTVLSIPQGFLPITFSIGTVVCKFYILFTWIK